MLRVNLFGPGHATVGNQQLVGFPNHRCCLLLSYLLLNRKSPIHRERLAAVFWSDYSTQVSRKHLRTAIWRLRRNVEDLGSSLDQFVEIADGSVRFTGQGDYWLDVEVFESLILKAEDIDGHRLTIDQTESLEQAIDLYTGDLLEGVYEDWCVFDRERLSLLLLSALSKLMIYHGTIGNYEKALAYGHRILSRDNTREKVHRDVMWLYALAGDRSAALAQYNLCSQILRKSLDVAPMEDTKRLYELILHEQAPPGAPTLPAPHYIETGPQPQAEQALFKLHRLENLLEETRAELGGFAQLINNTFGSSRQN